MPSGTIQLNQFAEEILFGTSLEQKLMPAQSIDFAGISTGAFITPSHPGRPDYLQFDLPKTKNEIFPTRIDSERSRGIVLHYFANHELLALELMALVLLKFPELPINFKRGLVGIMSEEQQHLKLYIDRMEALGVTMGELPVNSFFWRSLKDLSSPTQFLAAMSMTFEQANLDFANHFCKQFAKAGDQATATIMKKVYEDEIGHVKHGVHWFNEWRPKQQSLWKEYLEELRMPMTAARGKAMHFDVDARKRAGFDEEFISELNVYSSSKGRPARIFLFNAGFEQCWERKGFSAKNAEHLVSDLSPLLAQLALSCDIVMTPKIPSREWLETMSDMPEFLTPEDLASRRFQERKLWSFEPWGWDRSTLGYFGRHKRQLIPSSTNHQFPFDSTEQDLRYLYSKSLASDLMKTLPTEISNAANWDANYNACVAHNPKDAEAAFESFWLKDVDKVVCKPAFNASGRGFHFFNRPDDYKPWTRSYFKKHAELIIEPWLDRVHNVSVLINVQEEVRVLGISFFETTKNGQYSGHILGRKCSGWPPELLQLWHQGDNAWKDALAQTGKFVGQKLRALGFRGAAGIDAFIYRKNDSWHLRPLVEVNARWTMGHIALKLEEKIAPGRSGFFRIERKSDFLNRLNATPDVTYDLNRKITSGVLPLSDPNQCVAWVPYLGVG